jgi:hypothetical protein
MSDVLSIVDTDVCPDDFALAEPEDYRFVRAFQAAGIGDFCFGYLLVYRAGLRISVLPYFTTEYQLNTLVTNVWLGRLLAPLSFKVACVGHPSTDEGRIEGEISAEILDAANAILRGKAAATAYKWFSHTLPLNNFVEVTGLPVNILHATPGYPASLERNRRKNVMKKLKKSAALTFIEHAPGAALSESLLDDIHRLYEATAVRAEIHFERLNIEYFRLTAELSTYMLAYEGERLVGFIQWLRKGREMSGKYVGMDYSRNRQYSLYYGMGLQSVLASVRKGVHEFDLGVGSYYSKRLMGAHTLPTRLYFKHHNPLLQWLLARCRFLLEPSAAELA